MAGAVKRSAAGRAAAHTPAAPARVALPHRIDGVDALRGIAIVLMVAYHFAFDLRFFRLLAADFEHDARWLAARGFILSSFLLLVGVSLVLAARHRVGWKHHARRVLVIAGCAVLASVASYVLFPASFIFFGTLHCIAVVSVLAWPLRMRPGLALAIGVAVVVAGMTLSHPAFDVRPLGWIGFMTHKPVTEDYVPLFPWAGVAFIGIAVGHALARAEWKPLAPLGRASPAALRWLGRHSLAVYMAHQPLLFALLYLIVSRR